MIITDPLKRDASISYYCEYKRAETDTEKNIYMTGYLNGYRHALKQVKRILLTAPNNKMRIEMIEDIINEQLKNKDYGQR